MPHAQLQQKADARRCRAGQDDGAGATVPRRHHAALEPDDVLIPDGRTGRGALQQWLQLGQHQRLGRAGCDAASATGATILQGHAFRPDVQRLMRASVFAGTALPDAAAQGQAGAFVVQQRAVAAQRDPFDDGCLLSVSLLRRAVRLRPP
nr:hypothetical protein [Tepidimonas sediminis]